LFDSKEYEMQVDGIVVDTDAKTVFDAKEILAGWRKR
jgi:hypothetical protein